MTQNIIKFIDYYIDNITFDRNPNFKFTGQSVKLKTKLHHDIKKIDDDKAKITLKYEILQDKNNSSPFSLNISISGEFKMKEWEKEENIESMKYDTAAIIFPYLRSAVTNITAIANFPPYVMPTINPHTFFKDKEK